jgi:hypothetical protein
MQQKYQPVGWLGILLGSKIYYNIASTSIEEKYPQILKEVHVYYLEQSAKQKRDSGMFTTHLLKLLIGNCRGK